MTSVYCQNSLNNYVGRVQTAGHYSTCPKGWVYLRAASRSCSKDSLAVKGTLVFQIKFCGKSRALRVAANR
jgi:hypothetical protein